MTVSRKWLRNSSVKCHQVVLSSINGWSSPQLLSLAERGEGGGAWNKLHSTRGLLGSRDYVRTIVCFHRDGGGREGAEKGGGRISVEYNGNTQREHVTHNSYYD